MRQGPPHTHIHKHKFSIAKALRTNPENSVKKGGSVSLPQSHDLGEQVPALAVRGNLG